MNREKIWQQGAGDGLCGVYALANFFRHVDAFDGDKDCPDQLIFLLLEQVYSLGWLTPHFIKCGFAPHHLKAIANRLIEMHSLPFEAETISNCPIDTADIRPYIYIKRAIELGGCAIVDWCDKDHWVLARGLAENKIVIWNSDDAAKPEIKLSAKSIGGRDTPNGIIIIKLTEVK